MSDYYAEPPLFAAARRTDPPTSHAAAARAPVSEHGRRILEALLPPPVRPTGVTGSEYRRQWNRLNRERVKAASKRWLERHPERQRPIPREVVQKYRRERRNKDKPRYYSGWEQAKNRRTRWTLGETELLTSFAGTDRELSKLLGRSISAIQHRRHLLLKG